LQQIPGRADDAPVHAAVVALSLEEKGFVLGALIARMPPAEGAARIGGDAGARCGAALATLAEETRAARAAAVATLTALVRAPIPAGLARIHPDWLRERLGRESPAVVRAITGALPEEVRGVAADVLRERGDEKPVADRRVAPGFVALLRTVFAGFVPMAGAGAPVTPIARELAALEPGDLVLAIETRGAEVLGRSLRGAPAAVVARAAASLGENLAPVLLEAARGERANADTATRDEARRIVAAAGTPAAGDAAFAIGVHAVGAALRGEGDGALRAVAQRLPPEAGRRLLAAAEGSA
jgi:hypothetical protein